MSLPTSRLNRKKRYLQVALNGTLEDARAIIEALPISDRIIVEAGTPLIKRYGESGIRQITDWYTAHVSGEILTTSAINTADVSPLILQLIGALADVPVEKSPTQIPPGRPYVVADLKTMDRGETEVEIAEGKKLQDAILGVLMSLTSSQVWKNREECTSF